MFFRKLPGVLVAVVLSIVAARVFQLDEHGVKLVGTLPQGFPPLTIPSVHLSDLSLLVGGALGIVIVTLADTIATASAFATRSGQEFDGSQEMIGIGAANIAAGFFQGFPVSTSGSRTAVAEQSGAKTQVTGLVGALAIVLMLVLVPGLLRNLPQPTLAAVVIVASLSLADIPGTVRLWHQRREDFLVAIAAFLGVVLLGVLAGIAVAVALSIISVFRHAWWPYQAVLGRVDGLPGYHDLSARPDAAVLPGLVMFRFDAPLFFANARTFRDQIRKLASAEPKPAWIVVAAEPITDVDTTAADMLEDLDEELNCERRLARLRGAERPGPRQDRALPPHAHGQPTAFLPDDRRRRCRIPSRERRELGCATTVRTTRAARGRSGVRECSYQEGDNR